MSGGEVSVTAVVGPKTVPALPKQQPPIVSMFPVTKISQDTPPILQPEVQVKGMILFLVYRCKQSHKPRIFVFALQSLQSLILKAYVSEDILNWHCLNLHLNADLCIHFY